MPDPTVRKIALPPASRAQSTLARVDYTDSFLVATDHQHALSAEQWARKILESSPAFWRRALPRGWRLLGLDHVAVGAPNSILGWPIALTTPDSLLLSAPGHRGLSGELLVERRPDGVLFATMVQHHNRLAALEWALITPPHQLIVAHLLRTAHRATVSS